MRKQGLLELPVARRASPPASHPVRVPSPPSEAELPAALGDSRVSQARRQPPGRRGRGCPPNPARRRLVAGSGLEE